MRFPQKLLAIAVAANINPALAQTDYVADGESNFNDLILANGDTLQIINFGNVSSSAGTAVTVSAGASVTSISIDSANGVIDGFMGGIVVGANGTGATVDLISNSGTIISRDTTTNTPMAIDTMAGSTIGQILNNSGAMIKGVEGGIIIDESTVTNGILNNGTICGADGQLNCITSGGSAIIVRGASASLMGGITNNTAGVITGGIYAEDGATIDTISNIGTINGDGGGAIVAANGGAINSVLNGGTINGLVDFGTNGGSYTFTGGSQNGEIRGATSILAATYGQSGQNVSSLNNSLTFSGVLGIGAIANSSGIDHGLLFVDGPVNLDNATVAVIVGGEEFFQEGATFDIVHSFDAISANGITVEDNSLLLEFSLLQNTALNNGEVFNRLQLQTAFASMQSVVEDVEEGLEELGIDPSSQGAANGLAVVDAVINDLLPAAEDLPADSEINDFIDGLASISDQGELARAISTLDPETVEGSSVGAQAADAAAAGTVNQRQAALREGASATGMVAGDLLSVHGFWVQGYVNNTEQDKRDEVNGFDADTGGVAMGLDAAATDQINVGVAFSWANTDVDTEGVERNTMDIDSYRFTVYGAYNAEAYYVDAQLAYATNTFDMERTIVAGTYNAVATSEHDGDQYSLRVRGGYPMAVGENWYITPRAGLEYTYLTEDTYTEDGAGDMGLRVETDDMEVLLGRLGVKVAYPIVTESEVTWIPEFSADISHDFIGDEVELDSNFLGVAAAAFRTQGANVEQTGYSAGVRIRTFSQNNFSFSAGYDFLYKEDYESHSFNATVRYDF